MQHRFNVPNKLDFRNSIEFVNTLQDIPYADEYLINFTEFTWIEPFGLLFISTGIQELARRLQTMGRELFAENFENKNPYAAHVGFFKNCGINYGKAPGEAYGNLNYIPITTINTEDIRHEARTQAKEIGDVIDGQARRLSQTLTRQIRGDLVEALTYTFREIIRNVIDHSHSTNMVYCAQYWPTRRSVEIVILDKGIGIQSSLLQNPRIIVANDYEALCLCLMPGISGKPGGGGQRKPYDVWENSGFGLYMISRLCGNKGNFYIGSGNTGLLLEEGRKEKIDTNFSGTILRLSLNTVLPGRLSRIMTKFAQEGDEIAKQYSGEEFISSLSASKLLSSDFFI